jgi:hypothetical protein
MRGEFTLRSDLPEPVPADLVVEMNKDLETYLY